MSAHWYSTESPITEPLDETLLDDDVAPPPDDATLLEAVAPPPDDDVEASPDDVGPPPDAALLEETMPLDDVLVTPPPLPLTVVLEVVAPTPLGPVELVDELDPPVPGRTGSSPVAHAMTRIGPKTRIAVLIDLVDTSLARMAHLSPTASAQ